MSVKLFMATLEQTRSAWAVPPGVWRVLYVLASLADDDGVAVETIEGIAELADIAERNARMYLGELRRLGFVKIIRRSGGPGFPNVYRVSTSPTWEKPRTGKWYDVPTAHRILSKTTS